MTRTEPTRRGMPAAGALGPGAMGLGSRPAATQVPVALQPCWLHSVQFAGSHIATADSLANRRADPVALMAGEVRDRGACRADTAAATDPTLKTFPVAGLDRSTQKLQADRQVPLMFSDLTDETVAAHIGTLALFGRAVAPDLWDRSVLEEVHGA